MIKDTLPVDARNPVNDPADTEAQLAQARRLFEANDPARAEALLAAMHARVPARDDVAWMLAEVRRSQGRLSGASQALYECCDACGFEPALSLRCAEFARQCDRHEVAARITDAALLRGTAPPELLMLAGHLARESGDFTKARARYHAAMDADIDLTRHHVLAALANTRRYDDAADSDIARLEAHFRNVALPISSRASAGFGLAKIRDDLGDYEAGAGVLREANAMAKPGHPWDRRAWDGFVESRVRDAIVPGSGIVDPGYVPVFIVGVPRSGTTLTASLLARATGARDRGELRALRYIGAQLVGGGHLGSTFALTEAATLYRALSVQDDAPARWYVDQDPLNFRWLHVVAAMFPQARVIHLRRDPRDTALSLWGQEFAHPDLGFAYDFHDMAAFMHGHEALMQHWRAALSLEIFELDYDTLVSEPVATVARLADFIGARDVSPAEPDRVAPVQSASVWQARQPVYATSVGRWRNYAAYVPELARFALP